MQDIVIYHLKAKPPEWRSFLIRTALFVILWSNRGIRFCNTDHIRRSQRALACPAVCRNGCSRCTSGYPVLFPLHIWQGGPGQQRTAAPRQSYRNRPARWQNCSKQTDCFFRRPCQEAHRPFPEETIRRRSRWFPAAGLVEGVWRRSYAGKRYRDSCGRGTSAAIRGLRCRGTQ